MYIFLCFSFFFFGSFFLQDQILVIMVCSYFTPYVLSCPALLVFACNLYLYLYLCQYQYQAASEFHFYCIPLWSMSIHPSIHMESN